MYKLLHETTIATHHIPQGTNYVVQSILQQFSKKFTATNFSIKYVKEGIEDYTINHEKYKLSKEQYLLINGPSEGSVIVDSNRSVKGICLSIQPEILSEIFATLQRPDTSIVDLSLDTMYQKKEAICNQYFANQTHLGSFLQQLSKQFEQDPFYTYSFNKEFYFSLAENIIKDQQQNLKQLHNIPSLKRVTKNELLKKIMRSKEFMDSCYTDNLKIETVAKEAQISEYYFYRLFKSVYKISPHQYLINKKLEHASQLLSQDKHSVTLAAIEVGFGDIHSFSKAFKKKFGFTPSALLKNN